MRSGIAAINVGGVTLHSFAGIGLGREPVNKLYENIKNNRAPRERWLSATTLIIDESMFTP
jgi:ATP-dependent DNA helicase PIF1